MIKDLRNYRELLSIDKNHIWHPYTQMKEYTNKSPLFIVRAKGIKLYDWRGNFYYDTISSWWCNLLGHNLSRINRAIYRQARQLEHTLFAGITHEPAIKLVEELKGIIPPHLVRYFFSDNGSTAVEVALKMSYQYWQMKGKTSKKYFVFLEKGYHGDTIGAMSVSGVSQFNSIFSALFFKSFMLPSPADNLDESLTKLKKLLSSRAGEICAVIIEPLLQGAGGMRFYSKVFLDELELLRQKWGIHVIVDEIATGFGRLGRWFAHTESKLRPEFMCISKSITNGTLPLGLTVTTEKIYRGFLGDYATKTFFHGHTFTANPIACRAAVETIRILKEKQFIGNVKKIEGQLEKLAAWMKNKPIFKNVSVRGVILRAEIPRASRKQMFALYQKGLEHHLILRPLGNVVYLFLPITTSLGALRDISKEFKQVFGKGKCFA